MTESFPTPGGRTVLERTTVSKDDEWWVAVVRDRAPRTGDIRIRLERLVRDATEGWTLVHSWRVRPEFWREEMRAVARFQNGAGSTSPPSTPTDPDLDVTRYLRVRKDDERWVAVVRVERPYSYPCTRLYQWELPDETTRQKWTVGRDWARASDIATRQVDQLLTA